MSVLIAYAPPPFVAFFDPVVELARGRPRCRLHLDRRLHFEAINVVPLAVLTKDHVEICRLLVSFVLAEIGRAPAHYSSVEDSPHTRPNVASMEPPD